MEKNPTTKKFFPTVSAAACERQRGGTADKYLKFDR